MDVDDNCQFWLPLYDEGTFSGGDLTTQEYADEQYTPIWSQIRNRSRGAKIRRRSL